MSRDRSIYLLILQALLLVGLLLPGVNAAGLLHQILLAVLLVITGLLLWMRLRFWACQKNLTEELRRALQGNLNTRLLTGDDQLLDDVVFSINQLIEQLDNLHIQTIKSEAARKRLLSNFSHDIRTPLTSIIGYMDALKDEIGASEEERQEYIAIVLRKANALKSLIDEIFHLAKLDADEVPLTMERLDLAEMVREAVIDFLPELNRCEMSLEVNIPETPCRIMADRLSIQRVLGNVIKNAVQYGREGGVLGVDLTAGAGEFEVHIWDRGAGIPREDLLNIFERLYRADQARRTSERGSGLGLAIARALVEKNGGRIWAESVPGEKTVFHISMPELRNN